MLKTKLIVITVTRNDYCGLKNTIESLFPIKNFIRTHIIVDGNSSDQSKVYLEEYKLKEKEVGYKITSISENDKGIFDAMNKAVNILKTTCFNQNDYIWFLNAGDLAIENDYSLLDKFDNELLFFSAQIKKINNENILFRPNLSINNETFNNWIKIETPVHQAVFFLSRIINEIHFDLSFPNQADSKLIYELYSKYLGSYIGLPVCVFYYGGLSSNYSNSSKCLTQFVEQLYIINSFRKKSWLSPIFLYIVFGFKHILTRMFGPKIFSKLHFVILKYKYL